MRLLLDTHVFLWWLRDDRRLGRDARDRIADPESDVRVSAVSIWEIAIKASIGKIRWQEPAASTLATSIRDCGFSELPITAAHAAAVRDLPFHHADPFDRMLVAQSRLESLRVVSADPEIALYVGDVIRP